MKTYIKFIFQTEAREAEIVSATLFDMGCLGIHEPGPDIYEAFFHADDKKSREIIKIFKEEDLKFSLQYVENIDWSEEWKKRITPVHLTKNIMVLSDWMKNRRQDKINIILRPKMAFGTGHHESTRICAQLTEKYSDDVRRLLDVGTGSGILAIAAEKLGIREIFAMDIDPVTRDAAVDNIVINRCTRVRYFIGSVHALNPNQRFDAVCANILSTTICELMPCLHGLIGKRIIFSGILDTILS
jgi:ribosomal protein L11 methyltransferase